MRLTIEPDVEKWRGALRWVERHSDVLEVSGEDIQALYAGMRIDMFIDESLEAGVAPVVVTWRERGVGAVTRSQLAVEVPAVPVTVVDTAGAGATFEAGLAGLAAARRQAHAARGGRPGPGRPGGGVALRCACTAIAEGHHARHSALSRMAWCSA